MELKYTGIKAEIWIKGMPKATMGWDAEVFEDDGQLCVFHPLKPVIVPLNAYLENDGFNVRLHVDAQ